MKTIADKSRQSTVDSKRLEEILGLAEAVVSAGKLELVSEICHRALPKVLWAERSALFLVDSDRKVFYPACYSDGKGEPLGEGVVGQVITTGKILRLPDGSSKKNKKGGANDM